MDFIKNGVFSSMKSSLDLRTFSRVLHFITKNFINDFITVSFNEKWKMAMKKDPGVLLKDPGVLLKEPGVLLKDPGVPLKDPGVLLKGPRGPFKRTPGSF